MKRRALFVLFLTVFIDLLGFGIVIPLLPVYAAELNACDATIGLLLASYSLMQFLSAPLWGALSDRIGRRPVLLMGLLGSTTFYTVFGVATRLGSLPLLFVSRIGGGIMAATIPTAQAYIADVTPGKGRASGMALLGMAFGLGFTFGPIIGAVALLAHQQGTEMSPVPGYLAGCLSGLGFLLGLVWLPEPEHHAGEASQTRWPRLAQFRRLVGQPGLILLASASFLATFAFANFETTLARFVRDVYQFAYYELLLLFAGIGFVLAVAQGGIIRPLARRISERSLMSGGSVLLFCGMAGLAGSAHNNVRIALVIATVLTVVGYAALPPSIQALLSRLASEGDYGTVLGVGQSASALARIVGPVAGNVLYGVTSTHDAPYICGAIVACLVLAIGATVRSLAQAAPANVDRNRAGTLP